MIYEHRIYDAAPGKLEELHNRFRNHTLKFFEKHGIKPIAFFTTVVGTSNQLNFILAFESLAERERIWNGFMADQDWQKALRDSNANGPIVLKMENKIYSPTDYSPLK